MFWGKNKLTVGTAVLSEKDLNTGLHQNEKKSTNNSAAAFDIKTKFDLQILV